MHLLQDRIYKLTKPGDYVLDAGCGMFSADLACSLLQQHFRFVIYERNQNFVTEEMSSPAKTFARKLANKDADLTASENFE